MNTLGTNSKHNDFSKARISGKICLQLTSSFKVLFILLLLTLTIESYIESTWVFIVTNFPSKSEYYLVGVLGDADMLVDFSIRSSANVTVSEM